MGDSKQEDDSRSESSDPSEVSSEARDPRASANERRDVDPPSSSMTAARPVVRRSSLRPAPPSFRPTARDAAQLRPAMVIHAGDSGEQAPHWDIPEPAPSQPSQVPLDSASRLEPFALAGDIGANAADGITLPLVIPPPGALPRETREASQTHANSTDGAGTKPSAARFDGATSAQPNVSPSSVDESNLKLPLVTTAVAASDAVAGAKPSPSQHRSVLAIASAVLLFGIVTATVLRSNKDDAAETPSRIDAVPPVATMINDTPPAAQGLASAKTAEATSNPTASTAATPPASGLASAAEVPPNSPQAPVGSAAAAPPPSTTTPTSTTAGTADTVRVTLDVRPPDSKVIYRGTGHPGPPYEFDVPKGKRIVLEVARTGYATRKVVLDDTSPLVSIGLMKKKNSR